METSDFTGRVLDRFSREITDLVFLSVQNDPELMHEYLALVSQKGHDVVNRSLGRAVKARFGLENLPTREGTPRSTLIKSHREFQ